MYTLEIFTICHENNLTIIRIFVTNSDQSDLHILRNVHR